MRQFILINSNGEEWSLNDSDSFLSDPTGLGFEWDFDFENYNNVFKQTKKELKQPSPEGTIYFTGYEQYHKFILFAQYSPLTLKYTSYGTYYMDVEIEKLEKTEIGKMDMLESGIKFVGLSPWYEKITISNSTTLTGKTYNYSYPYTYVDSDSGTVTFEVLSNMESGVKLTMLGPLTNPSWGHTVNGVKVTSGKITAVIPSADRLIIDSTGSPYTIHEVDASANLIEDLYQCSDWTTERFIILKPGTNIITCTHEGTEKISMIMEAHVNYAGI